MLQHSNISLAHISGCMSGGQNTQEDVSLFFLKLISLIGRLIRGGGMQAGLVSLQSSVPHLCQQPWHKEDPHLRDLQHLRRIEAPGQDEGA